jgi:serine/threonine protein kinase
LLHLDITIYDYNFVIKTEGKVLDPYTVIDKLGNGGFATVRLAKYKGIDDYQFAMKSMRKTVEGIDMKPAIINELDILNVLDHPNIANFNECYEDDKYIHAILEFSPGKSLAQVFVDIEERLPIIDIKKIFYQI